MCLCINSLSTLRATIQIHPFLRQKTKNILLSSPSKHILITTKQIFEPKWNHFGQTHFCFSSSAMSTARNIREPHYPSKKKQRPIIATTKTISDGSVGGWLCERWGNGEMGGGGKAVGSALVCKWQPALQQLHKAKTCAIYTDKQCGTYILIYTHIHTYIFGHVQLSWLNPRIHRYDRTDTHTNTYTSAGRRLQSNPKNIRTTPKNKQTTLQLYTKRHDRQSVPIPIVPTARSASFFPVFFFFLKEINHFGAFRGKEKENSSSR